MTTPAGGLLPSTLGCKQNRQPLCSVVMTTLEGCLKGFFSLLNPVLLCEQTTERTCSVAVATFPCCSKPGLGVLSLTPFDKICT
jgi:hypothetical protein